MVDYTDSQGHDPGADLEKGDKVEGYLITKKVIPYLAGDDFQTKCTVPVFCSMEDPIEFELAMERAFRRAGKILAEGEIDYGLISEPREKECEKKEIPHNCLIVKHL